MKKLSFKQVEIIGAFFGVIVGTLLHFTYQLSGNNQIVAIFSAVNESVWEHTKMFFFPVLLYLIFEWRFVKDKKTLLLAKVLESIWGIIFIIIFYYTHTVALGIENFLFDIASFYIAVVIGKTISYYVVTSKFKWQGYKSLHITVLVLIALFFFVATFVPPKIPLFKDSNTNSYGVTQ